MNRALLTVVITSITFLALLFISFNSFIFSDVEKILYITLLSLSIGLLFRLKMNVQYLGGAKQVQELPLVGIWNMDLNQDFLDWSDELYKIFELDTKQFQPTYEKFLAFVHPEDREFVDQIYKKALEIKEGYNIQHRILTKTGNIKWIKKECKIEYNLDGTPKNTFSIVTDITHIEGIKKETAFTRLLQPEEYNFNMLIDATDDFIFFKDKDLNYLGCNDAFASLVGKSKEQIIGQNDAALLYKDEARTCKETDLKMLEEMSIRSNYSWITTPDGERRYFLTKKIPYRYNANDVGVLAISRDITELHLAQEKIKSQVFIDDLTKLNNRKSYNERLRELILLHKRYANTFSMIMYDIDNFKSINDNYGHNVGDNVLVQMSRWVQTYLRESDFIFRTGGEEFVILLTETSFDAAESKAQKICDGVASNLTHITGEPITISVGVSQVTESDNENSIFERVDALLYEAKKGGKNKVCAQM